MTVHRRLTPTQRVWGIGASVVLIIVVCAVLTIWDLHRKAVEEAGERLETLGFVLAEQTSRYVQVIDLLLRECQAHVKALQVQTPAEFESRLGSEEMHRFLRERMVNLPQANALVVVGAEGRVLNSSREWPAHGVDVSSSEVYAHLRDNEDAGLFFGSPMKSKVTGKWTVYLGRRIGAPDGAFLGIVTGALDIDYLADFYSAISANQEVRVGLLRRDGTILAYYPDTNQYLGKSVSPGSPWYQQVAAGRGSYFASSLLDETTSIISVNPLANYPVVIDVSIRQHEALEIWREQLIEVVAVTLVACGALIMLFGLIGRQFRRQQAQNLVLQRTAEAARIGEARLRDYAEMASDWFWEQDAELRFVSITAGTPMIGPDDTPFVGRRRWEMLETDTDDDRWRVHKEDLAARRPFRDFRYTLAGHDGRLHHVTVSGNPMFDVDGNFVGYRGTGRDITEDIEAAAALRLARDEAEAANRAKSEFLANMSHELRTPLHAIIGFAELLQDHPFSSRDARCADYARDIHASGRHLLDLINNVLDMSKIETGHYTLREERIDIEEVVRTCVGMLVVRAREGQVTIVSGGCEDTHLNADRLALKQIVLNLLSNAVKFTPPGGHVTIGGSVLDSGFRLAVVDTGIGISEAALPHLCDPFYQADASISRAYGGTGLGLAICNKLAQLHDGQLTIESCRGRGTTVSVLFPPERVIAGLRSRRVLT